MPIDLEKMRGAAGNNPEAHATLDLLQSVLDLTMADQHGENPVPIMRQVVAQADRLPEGSPLRDLVHTMTTMMAPFQDALAGSQSDIIVSDEQFAELEALVERPDIAAPQRAMAHA